MNSLDRIFGWSRLEHALLCETPSSDPGDCVEEWSWEGEWWWNSWLVCKGKKVRGLCFELVREGEFG